MNQVAADLEKQYPDSNAGYRVAVEARRSAADAKRAPNHHRPRPGRDRDLPARLHQHRSLVVVRTAGRQSEFSVRTALGASAARLSRQLMIEHMVLAAIAAVGSIGVVIGLRRLLTLGRLIPVEQLERANVGAAPIVFLIVLTVTTGLARAGWCRAAPRRPRWRRDCGRRVRRAKPFASARFS